MRLFIHPARAMVVPARLSHYAQGIHRRNLLRRPVAVACLMALGAVVSVDVFANCSPTAPAADTTVTCSGPTFIGNPFASSSNNLTFNVQPGGQVTSLLGISNAVLLSGTGNTVNNSGTIDPSLLGALSLLSGGVQLGSANASNQSVNNYGSLMGTASLISVNVGGGSLAGLALDVRNNTGGTTTIYNAGTISTTPLLGVSLVSADAPVIAVSGYGVVNMTNDTSGTITGRVAFEGGVNTFVNHGAISGSVYLGDGGNNTFTADTGSSVSTGGGSGAQGQIGDPLGLGLLTFAATGTVDAGLGANNTLILQGSGSSTASAVQYLDFQNLTVNSGTWNLQGNLVSGAATINAGQVSVNSAGVFGTGTLQANGGSLQATAAGLTLWNNVALNGGSFTLAGTNAFELTGSISGTGSLVVADTAPVTLGGINLFSGGISLNAGGLVLGNTLALGTGKLTLGGSATLDTIGSFTMGNDIAVNAGTLSLLGSNPLVLAGFVSGAGNLSWNGTGTLGLAGVDSLSGALLINAGTVKVNTGGNLSPTGAVAMAAGTTLDLSTGGYQSIGSLAGAGGTVNLGPSTLTLDGLGSTSFSGAIIGAGGLIKLGSGTQTLTGANTYLGGTIIQSGTLALGAGGSLSATGAVTLAGTGVLDISAGNQTIGSLVGSSGAVNLGNSTLALSGAGNASFAGVIVGTGGLAVNGASTQTLNGVNTYTGPTTVASGATLLVGDSSHTTATVAGDVNVSGGTLGGYGVVLGSATLSNGAVLAPGSAGAFGSLTVQGDLTIGNGSQVNIDFGAPGPNFTTPGQSDHVVVNGSLSIGTSTLNVSNVGSMGPGLYNLFTWGGALAITGGGFAPPSGMSLQILTVDKQINLIDALGLTINEWNANGLAGPSQMGGGSGTWSVSSTTWSDTNGQYIGAMAPQPNFAIFGGAAGTVTVDDTNGAVGVTGMQFVSDGYHLTGDAIDLVGQGSTAPVLRVGTGNTAIIDNVLAGTSGLNKTDGGTLVLTGNNVFTGTTTVSGGYLSLSSDANLGASANALDFEGGTLEITGTTFTQTARNIIWGSAGGGFDIDNAANTFTLAQAVNGSGGLVKSGAGTLVLTGANTFTGNTAIDSGTLALSGNGSVAQSVAVSVASGATFDIGNTSSGASITSLDGSGIVNLGSKTLTLTNPGSTFAGSISGSGGLSLAGGNEKLTGPSLYTGATVINAGTLALTGNGSIASSSGVLDNGSFDISGTSGGATIASLGGSGSVNLGNQTLTLSAANDHFGGIISGTGVLALTGGTEILTGSNSYSGGTSIGAGTLQVGNGGSTGAITSNVTNNGTLIFDRSDAVGFAGVISGTGTLTQMGSGTLTLTGSNSYSGGTTINAGTLVVDSASLPGAVTNHAALVFNQVSDGTFGSAISGNGSVVKTGAGMLILDADSSSFAGTTSVQAGTLEVGDAGTPSAVLGGNVTIASGGTLRGHGAIGGSVINDGTLWAGGSIGTLTVQGNYTQTANGVFQVEATPDGQASLLRVGGTATLSGAALVLADAGNWAPRTDYTVLTAAGGISGQFVSASSNLAFLTPVLDYTTNAVTLSLQRNDVNFSAVAQTPNQRAVASMASRQGFGNAIYDALVVLDAVTARRAFDQLSGEIHASTRTAIQDDDRYVRDAINQHLAGLTNSANGLNVTDDHGVTAWTAVWGHWGSHDDDGNASSLTADGSGLLMGADLPVGDDARLGAVLGTGQTTIRIAALGSSSHVLDQHIGVYGSAQTGPLQWQGGAIYGLQRISTSRGIDVGSLAGTAYSDYHAHTAQGYVDASWPIALGNTTLAPFVNLAYDNLRTPGFGESGTPAALSVASQNDGVGYGTLGLRASFDLGAPSHGLHMHAGVGWQHAWGDMVPDATVRFTSVGGSFDITGLPVAQNAAAVSGGISFTITPKVSVDASYQGQFAQRTNDQSARISVDWKF